MGSKRKWNPEFFSLDGEFMKKANDLLSDLIQIKSVNTGEVDSGNEIEVAKYCEKILNRENFKNIKIIESEPGRGSIICKWKGKDQNAPKLCLLGHLDVVPANE